MDTHPDPIQDALSHGLQRAVQIASSVATGAQAYAYLSRTHARTAAQHDAQQRRTATQQQAAARNAARASWAPGLDPRWLRQADVPATARIWSAAMPYADPTTPWHEPTAATAMHRAEEHLRDLHPTAMTYYDRLRSDGRPPAEAMREAAFLFAGPPSAYDPPYTPRPSLAASDGATQPRTFTPPPLPPGKSTDPAAAQERRAVQIIETLHARSRAHGRGSLGAAEQHIVLETVTNLPLDVIDRVVRTATPQQSASSQPLRPWERDFPTPIGEVVAAAASSSASSPSTTPVLTLPAPDPARRQP